jgi:hypothetical protein
MDVELHEFGHKAWPSVQHSRTIAILNQDVFPLDITEISQRLLKCSGSRIRISGGGFSPSRQKSYPRDFSRLLRVGHGCTRNQNHYDEGASKSSS